MWYLLFIPSLVVGVFIAIDLLSGSPPSYRVPLAPVDRAVDSSGKEASE